MGPTMLSEEVTELSTANARMKALVNIGLLLASEKDPDLLLQKVCIAARNLFGATYATFGILDRSDGKRQQIFTDGPDETTWIKIRDSVPALLQTVLAERRTLRSDRIGGESVGAFLVAPVASPNSVYGWIGLVGSEHGTFTDDDEQLVLALAGLVGRIYENGHFCKVALKEAEALRTADERTRFALQSADVGIWDMDYTTGELRWSETIEAHYGLKPGTFRGTFEAFVERIHPDDRESVLETVGKAMRTGTDFSVLHRTIWPDGSLHWLSGAGRILLDEHGKPLRGVGISLDATERRTLEAQYQQAQKMEAIGRLAGGVAHDFNNLLTVILGYCELLLDDDKPDDPHQADIVEIQKAGVRASGLTRQLLAFSRKQIIEPRLLDLNQIVGDFRGMLGRLIGEDVKVVLNLLPDLALVTADPGQVEQIVMNLAVNARDAMPNGGTLAIETANVELDEHYARTHCGVKPGPYVVLSVTDTGIGMTPEVQARLFEPFFTTKEAGKGTGLGLATVYGVVTRCGGSVGVYSEVGRGTSFKVYLPRTDATETIGPALASVAKPRVGTQTVLVVEDEAGLRELTKKLLQRQGYAVLVAADADDALRVIERHPSIDVLLTDVVMPGASGPDLTRRLAELRPALKVIYMSGYTEEAIVQRGVLKPGIAFLHKPFTSDTLGRKIRDVLDETPARFGAHLRSTT